MSNLFNNITKAASNLGRGILDTVQSGDAFYNPNDAEKADSLLIWRWKHNDIRSGSYIIVGESQEAIFVKAGQIAAIFPGGNRYSVSTESMPFLSPIMNLPFGGSGNTPYQAEIWFVNKTVQMDVKWGTPQPLDLADPKHGGIMVPVSANGTISIKVADSRNLFVNLVGQVPAFTMKNLEDRTKSIVRSKIDGVMARYVETANKSFTELRGANDEIGNIMRESIQEEFGRYGLSVEGCYVNVSVDPNDENVKRIRARAARRLDAEDNAEIAKIELGAERARIEGLGVSEINVDQARLERMGISEMQVEKARQEGLGYTYQEGRELDIKETLAGNSGNNAGALGATLAMSGVMANQMQGMLNNQQQVQQPTPQQQEQGIKCPGCDVLVKGKPKFCPECGMTLVKKCGACDAVIEGTPKFCPECGASTAKKCGACGVAIEGSPKFCPECGDKL